jgi:hypothetical protein
MIGEVCKDAVSGGVVCFHLCVILMRNESFVCKIKYPKVHLLFTYDFLFAYLQMTKRLGMHYL